MKGSFVESRALVMTRMLQLAPTYHQHASEKGHQRPSGCGVTEIVLDSFSLVHHLLLGVCRRLACMAQIGITNALAWVE
jgi:hypothetical protein